MGHSVYDKNAVYNSLYREDLKNKNYTSNLHITSKSNYFENNKTGAPFKTRIILFPYNYCSPNRNQKKRT